MNLQLEFGCWFHIRILIIIIVHSVDSFNSCLEHFHIVSRVVPETRLKVIIKRDQVSQVYSQVIFLSLGVCTKLLSIDKSIINLGLADEVHELVFSVGKTLTIVSMLVNMSSNQLLVSVVYLFSFKHFKLFMADTNDISN